MKKEFTKGIEKRIKFFVALIIFVVAVIAITVFCINIFNAGISSDKNIIVYRNTDGYVINIDNLETVITDTSACDFKCDKNNKRVFYVVESSYSDGLYDLYYIEKNRSEITKPKIIDYGIEKNYILNSGNIYFFKNNSRAGVLDALCCDFEKLTIKTFSSNVESVYPIDNSNTVFFIKLHADNRVLYKYSNESPIEVSRNVSAVHLYNNCETPHIIYETKSKIYNGMTELYRTEAEGAPELICDNTYRVFYEEYDPDGNLYYFTNSKENISWSYVIADEYSESDKSLIRPKRDNFFSILGISVEYNEKLREYQDKLIRDEIRDAMNECVEKGEFSAPVYTAFAYNQKGNHKIAENINPDKIYASSLFGSPKLIFESFEIAESVTDMSSLVEIAQRSTMSEVIDYARSVVNNSIKSKGIKIAGCIEEGTKECVLEGYDNENTMFMFSKDGNRFFALVRDFAGDRLKLYSSQIGFDMKPSPKENINNGISGYGVIDNSVIYFKSDIGKNTGDIYSYSGEENIKLSNAANALNIENGRDIVVMKNYSSSSSGTIADYYIIENKTEKLIAENVSVDSFFMNENGQMALITVTENGSELFVCSDDKISSISNDVSEILMFY